ncbi:hypothetical protein WMY93_014765 [Mugilogobius chulae]|uniref:Reverse transcriptase domain-containing protein n=1 Tax=Mugilogobius chulae TaxID=88201 RepID=A0AAW0NVG4_9GOBI
MAARTDAAARLSQWLLSVCVLCVYLNFGDTKYSRQELLLWGSRLGDLDRAGTFNKAHIPPEILRPEGSPWIIIPEGKRRRRRRDRRQKRGCRAGVRVRLKKAPLKPALPSIFLSNARSLVNKMDEMSLINTTHRQVKDCSILIISETWLHAGVPDEAIVLTGRSVHRADRNEESGKTRGGGLCIYTNNRWCTNATVIGKHCSPDLEYIVVRCRPFYMPREFTVVIAIAVYVPPSANAKLAMTTLLTVISKLQTAHPDGVFIVAGDFNRSNLKTVLPKFQQYVTCATRGHNTLDHVYCNIREGYKAFALPHLGLSDHRSIFLIPAYRPLIQKTPPSVRYIQTWPEEATAQLQDCFERTHWDLFAQQDITTYTETVLFYIQCCINNVTVEKKISCLPNEKPWMNREVKLLLKARDDAFNSKDEGLYSKARSNLKRGIKSAKAAQKDKIESHFREGDPRRVWQGIQHLTNYKGCRRSVNNGDSQLAEELNIFFGRFEKAETGSEHTPPSLTEHPPLTLTTDDVRKVFRKVNPRKATGPDGIPGRVLRDCADQLAEVFCSIFNSSLTACTVPQCFKSALIVPVPKKTSVESLNDYRPVALTSTVMKCFERLVQQHLKSSLSPHLDQHQFAYRANRSTADAINTALHTALCHLEHPNSYVRMLFLDFSSAFNCIIPSRLVSKLQDLGINPNTCRWVQDFLTNRLQCVRLGSHCSSVLTLNTGAPQGCVLSPLLYTLYTFDCRPSHPTNVIIKFADHTTVVGLIKNNTEAAYRDEVDNLVEWCSLNNLSLNSSKTKEVILDFRKKKETDPPPLYIKGDLVERVSHFKFLGTYICQDLTWTTNITSLVKKAQQRLYFLRTLRRANLPQALLLSFYRCSIESILTHDMLVWYSSCSALDKKTLDRVVKSAQDIIRTTLPSLPDLYRNRCLRRAKGIIQDSSHPAHSLFEVLPSGRRYRTIKSHTSRLTNSFYASAIKALNSE